MQQLTTNGIGQAGRRYKFDFDWIAGLQIAAAEVVALGVGDVPRLVRIAAGRERIEDAANGIIKVLRGDRFTIRPESVFAQMKRVEESVVGDFPFFSDAGFRQKIL